MRVRIIPEGVQHDHLILRPIFKAMFHHLGKDHVKVDIHSPEERGFDAVRATDYIRGIISEFRAVDLFVLCVDRDGDPHRREALNDLERKIAKVLPAPRLFLAERAWQEVEVWALAGIDWRLKHKWTWEAIRSVRDSKEMYFEPIARNRHLFDLPGQGRKELGEEALDRGHVPGALREASTVVVGWVKPTDEDRGPPDRSRHTIRYPKKGGAPSRGVSPRRPEDPDHHHHDRPVH
jgi:hypothetical protein